jgi:hypothetical protein
MPREVFTLKKATQILAISAVVFSSCFNSPENALADEINPNVDLPPEEPALFYRHSLRARINFANKFRVINPDADPTTDNYTNRITDDLARLDWMMESNLPVQIHGDGSAKKFGTSRIIKLARVFSETEKHFGLDSINRLVYCPNTCLDYRDQKDEEGKTLRISDAFVDTTRSRGKVKGNIYAEFYADADVIAHEIGHLVHYTSQNRLEFLRVRGSTGEVVTDSLAYVSDYAKTNDREDFAETFKEYLMDGKGFRAKINSAYHQNREEAEELHRRYLIMMHHFKGVEYSKDAIPLKKAA